MEGYRQRLAELVLRGMDSDVLSCRVSSTAVCVEVRLGAWRAGRAGVGAADSPNSLPWLLSGKGAQALRGI